MSEILNALPVGWAWGTFDDVAEVEANLVDPADYMDAAHVAPNHIETGTGRLLPYQTIRADAVTSPKHLFRPGQILYSKIRPYLAKAVRVDFPGLCSADMYPVRSDIDVGFLHQWLISPMFTVFASQSQGRSLLPKINQQALATKPVPVAPLNEQQRIVAKIESLQARSDAAKQALDAIPPLLEKLRQSVLAAAFRGDLTKAWREAHPDVEPASELLERIRAERRRKWEQANPKKKYVEPEPVDAEGLPELPEGWCWASVDEVSFVVRGASPRPAGDARYFGGDIPWITVGELTKDGLMHLDEVATYVTEAGRSASRYIPANNLLLSNSGATLGVPKINRIGGCINDGSVALLYLSQQMQKYLYFHLLSLTSWLRGLNQGAAQPNLNTTIVKRILVPLAPEAEQNLLLTKLNSALPMLVDHTDRVASNLDLLAHLNQSILANAFRGELVPQDPTDEPASVLLDRIRTAREAKVPGRRPRKPKAAQ